MRYSVIICIFTSLVLFGVIQGAPNTARAQLVPELNDVLVLSAIPSNPGPNQEVRLNVTSYSIDANNARISWFVNDVLQQQSIGGTDFSFTTGALGSASTITVAAEVDGSVVETEQITIRPTEVDLLWQADTFAHPFYEGKRLPSVGSVVRVEAVPYLITEGGARLDPDSLTYTWRVDGNLVQSASGRGKHTLTTAQTKPVNSLGVSVEITSPDGILSRQGSLFIPLEDPQVLVYENNPLLGILFNRAVTDRYTLSGQETRFITYPFYMSLVNRNDEHIVYTWQLEGTPIELGEDRGSITVSHSGDGEGESGISVSVRNTREFFQESSFDFIIEFGRQVSSGFGL